MMTMQRASLHQTQTPHKAQMVTRAPHKAQMMKIKGLGSGGGGRPGPRPHTAVVYPLQRLLSATMSLRSTILLRSSFSATLLCRTSLLNEDLHIVLSFLMDYLNSSSS